MEGARLRRFSPARSLRSSRGIRLSLSAQPSVLAPYVFGIAMGAAKRPAGTYSSRKGHAPPGYSDEAWKPIAAKIGTRRGRWFVVSQEQLEAYERGEKLRGAGPLVLSSPSKWSPADAASSLRLRAVR